MECILFLGIRIRQPKSERIDSDRHDRPTTSAGEHDFWVAVWWQFFMQGLVALSKHKAQLRRFLLAIIRHYYRWYTPVMTNSSCCRCCLLPLGLLQVSHQIDPAMSELQQHGHQNLNKNTRTHTHTTPPCEGIPRLWITKAHKSICDRLKAADTESGGI